MLRTYASLELYILFIKFILAEHCQNALQIFEATTVQWANVDILDYLGITIKSNSIIVAIIIESFFGPVISVIPVISHPSSIVGPHN